MIFLLSIIAGIATVFLPLQAVAAESQSVPGLASHPAAVLAVVFFVASYIAVFFEEKIHLRKSKPVLLGAAVIWVTIGVIAKDSGIDHDVLHAAIYHGLEEYGSLLMFLLAAMTYISALEDRNVFGALRARLVKAGFTLRQLFWITGAMAFFISPFADNLTTALVMGAVVMALGAGNAKFVSLACINIVSAANAGGAFSPFGDITTLMVWQAEKIEFFGFFALFIPSAVCFLVPAAAMSFFVPAGRPPAQAAPEPIKRCGVFIIFLGLLTIALAVGLEQFLGLPPFMGMMAGLSLLMFTAYYLRTTEPRDEKFDVLELVASAEWDTLLFFFGIIFSVSGLAFLGYMEMASAALYDGWGASAANIAMGAVSAVVDNIPIMFAVLTMDPEMDRFQWLLITLTTGVGGSMLSIGSAAGVALMGVARGQYTFLSHLKWTPVIALGYAAAIFTHFVLNG